MTTKNIKGYSEYLNESLDESYASDSHLIEIKGTPEYAFAMEGMRMSKLIDKTNPVYRDGVDYGRRKEYLDRVIEGDIIPTLNQLYTEFGDNPIFSMVFYHYMRNASIPVNGKTYPMEKRELLDDAFEEHPGLQDLYKAAQEGTRIAMWLKDRILAGRR